MLTFTSVNMKLDHTSPIVCIRILLFYTINFEENRKKSSLLGWKLWHWYAFFNVDLLKLTTKCNVRIQI